MITKRSPLLLQNFVVLDSNIKANFPQEISETNPLCDSDSYPVLIDFQIEKKEDEELYRIFVDLSINPQKESGYSASIKALGIFAFSDELPVDEATKSTLLRYSGLSICITNVRSYIFNQTSYFPWGPFMFYAIDVNDLLEQKEHIPT